MIAPGSGPKIIPVSELMVISEDENGIRAVLIDEYGRIILNFHGVNLGGNHVT